MPNQQIALHEFHRGISLGYQARAGYYASDDALAQIDQMAALNIRWVALMVNVMQETFYSTRLFHDYVFTPTDAEVENYIERLHEKGIRVMLKPMVECLDSSWRGRITFPDGDQQIQGVSVDYWSRWFESHTASLVHYGQMAQRTGVELFCVGCELDGTQRKTEHWREAIAALRAVYAGPLTYDPTHSALDRGEPCDWFDELDLLGLSFYFPAADKAGATVDEMVEFLQPRVEQMRRLHERFNLPIVFAETGTRSFVRGGVDHDYREDRPYDGSEQANYIEATLKSFWNQPWWLGMYIWKWDEQQHRPQYHTDPAGDTGFTIAGKPAADIVKRWYGRTDRP